MSRKEQLKKLLTLKRLWLLAALPLAWLLYVLSHNFTGFAEFWARTVYVGISHVFHTVSRCRELLRTGGIRIVHEVASDGVSELLQELINGMDDETYAQYLRYHFYICEKPECIGMSNHLLFVGEKE